MIRTIAFVFALSATAACAEPAGAPLTAPPGPPPPVLIPESLPAPMPTPSQPPLTAAHCEATDLAWLVGKPRTEIPVPVDPSHRRVYCSTCLVTQD